MSLALKLGIPSHDTHKNKVSERNMCYLLICKEGPLALHRHPSHYEFFLGAVISSCVACVIYYPILLNYLTKYLVVQTH